MTMKATPESGLIMPFPTRAGASLADPQRQRSEKARYISQMTLELERLAGTADMGVLAYFLAMARAEAEAIAAGDDQP